MKTGKTMTIKDVENVEDGVIGKIELGIIVDNTEYGRNELRYDILALLKSKEVKGVVVWGEKTCSCSNKDLEQKRTKTNPPHIYQEGKEPKGFMVEFEHRIDGMLRSSHFPDKHAGEPLIKTEEEAWELARNFAEILPQEYVNIYVIKENFFPVECYEEKKLRKY